MTTLSRSPRPGTAVGASSEGLVGAVLAVCAAELVEVRIPNAAGGLDEVRIVRNMFDPKDHGTANMPTLLVRYHGGGVDEEGYRTTNVDLQLDFTQAAYGDDEFGVSIMDGLMIALVSRATIGGRYRLRLPFTWDVSDGEEQPTWPNWRAVMTASYYVPTIADVSVADLI